LSHRSPKQSALKISAVPDFSSGSSKSGIKPNPKPQLISEVVYHVFAILISVTRAIKVQNTLPFHKFCQKLANGEVTKEALDCTASL